MMGTRPPRSRSASRKGRSGAEAVHDGHLDIHQDDVEFFLQEQVHRLLAVVGPGHVHHGLFQNARGQLGVDGVVFHQQDPQTLEAGVQARVIDGYLGWGGAGELLTTGGLGVNGQAGPRVWPRAGSAAG